MESASVEKATTSTLKLQLVFALLIFTIMGLLASTAPPFETFHHRLNAKTVVTRLSLMETIAEWVS